MQGVQDVEEMREEDKPKYVIIWKNVNEIRACQNTLNSVDTL